MAIDTSETRKHIEANQTSESICFVDPRKIVNEFCARPVARGDSNVVMEGFKQNGYVDTNLISCRLTTYPELKAFFRRHPYNYSPEKADEVTRTEMEKGEGLDYYYCFDGHIRKYVCIELMSEGILDSSFRLKSIVKLNMSKEEEIAYSVAVNGNNEFSVPIPFLALLLRCREYDGIINKGKLKPLSGVEAGKG